MKVVIYMYNGVDLECYILLIPKLLIEHDPEAVPSEPILSQSISKHIPSVCFSNEYYPRAYHIKILYGFVLIS